MTYKNKPGYGSLCGYLYGFVCHYALDSTAHPYVYSLITKLDGQSSTKRHIQVESEIGSLMYRRLTGMPVSSFKIYEHYSKNGEFVTPISKMYVYLVKNLLDKTVLCNEVKSGFSFCLFTNYFTYFLARNELSCKTKTVLLKGIKALVKKLGIVNCFIKCDSVSHDTLNLMHNEWYNLNDPGKIFTYSFPELFDIAKDEAVGLAQKCNEMLKNNEITVFSISKCFDNGEPHKESKKGSEKIPTINFQSVS